MERSRRLESDAAAVQIITVHRSKGLEFPVVYVPFGWDRNVRDPDVPLLHDDARPRGCSTSAARPATGWTERCARHRAEEAGEDLRLLYVGADPRPVPGRHLVGAGDDTRPPRRCTGCCSGRARCRGAGTVARPIPGRCAAERTVPTDAAAAAALRAWAGPGSSSNRWSRRHRSRPAHPAASRTGRCCGPPGSPASSTPRWRRTSYSRADRRRRRARGWRARIRGGQRAGGRRDRRRGWTDRRRRTPEVAAVRSALADGRLPARRRVRHARARRPRGGRPHRARPARRARRAAAPSSWAAGRCRASTRTRWPPRCSRWPTPRSGRWPAGAGWPTSPRRPAGRARLRAPAGRWRRPRPPTVRPLGRRSSPAAARTAAGPATIPLRRDTAGRAGGYPRLRRAAACAATSPAASTRCCGCPAPRYRWSWTTRRTGSARSADADPLTAAHYTAPRLAEAMIAAHYPLQALLYGVALHRFLRWRLPGYEPAAAPGRRALPVRARDVRAGHPGGGRRAVRGVQLDAAAALTVELSAAAGRGPHDRDRPWPRLRTASIPVMPGSPGRRAGCSREFNRAGVLDASDVHVATRVGAARPASGRTGRCWRWRWPSAACARARSAST